MISYQEASLLISKTFVFNKDDFKKLSQSDRKTCIKAVEILTSRENAGLPVDFVSSKSFCNLTSKITNTLKSKSPGYYCLIRFFPIRLMISGIKGLLNYFRLRVSSVELSKKINAGQKYLSQVVIDSPNRYFDIIANCELSAARIIFIGDCHIDPIQIGLRQIFISNYANVDKNLILHEGLDSNEFPQHLGSKKFREESWETPEHYKKAGELANLNCKRTKQVASLLAESKKIANKNKVSIEEADRIINETIKLENEAEQGRLEIDKIQRIRDEDLVSKVKMTVTKDVNQKIFAIAGRKHLLREDYKILDLFDNIPCAVVIPKDSYQTGENRIKFRENLRELGAYDASYKNLPFS